MIDIYIFDGEREGGGIEKDHTYVIITEQKVPFKIHEMEKHEKKRKKIKTQFYM